MIMPMLMIYMLMIMIMISKLIGIFLQIRKVRIFRRSGKTYNFKIGSASINFSNYMTMDRRCRETDLIENIASLVHDLIYFQLAETRAQLCEARNELLLYYDHKIKMSNRSL